MDTIAEQNAVFLHPDGRRVVGSIRIGKPYVVSEGEARCPVAIDGLYPRLSEIAGSSTLQALTLATQLCHRLLSAFVEGGGRVLDGESGGDLPIDVLFGRG